MQGVPFQQRLQEVMALKEGWSNGRGLALRLEVLAAVADLAIVLGSGADGEEPTLTPLANGFVRVEWTSENRILNFEATEPGWYVVGTNIRKDGVRSYQDVECGPFDHDMARRCFKWYLGEDAAWPSSNWIPGGETKQMMEEDQSSAWRR